MMVRMQVTIDAELHRRAREHAVGRGISFAEYVRRLVAEDLGDGPPRGDVTAIFDLGGSGEATDIATDKDRLIGEAVEAEYRDSLDRG